MDGVTGDTAPGSRIAIKLLVFDLAAPPSSFSSSLGLCCAIVGMCLSSWHRSGQCLPDPTAWAGNSPIIDTGSSLTSTQQYRTLQLLIHRRLFADVKAAVTPSQIAEILHTTCNRSAFHTVMFANHARSCARTRYFAGLIARCSAQTEVLLPVSAIASTRTTWSLYLIIRTPQSFLRVTSLGIFPNRTYLSTSYGFTQPCHLEIRQLVSAKSGILRFIYNGSRSLRTSSARPALQHGWVRPEYIHSDYP